ETPTVFKDLNVVCFKLFSISKSIHQAADARSRLNSIKVISLKPCIARRPAGSAAKTASETPAVTTNETDSLAITLGQPASHGRKTSTAANDTSAAQKPG